MAKEVLRELTEESLYCDYVVKNNASHPSSPEFPFFKQEPVKRLANNRSANNRDDSEWVINTLSIDRSSALYHKIVNDSLPFYFISPYRYVMITDNATSSSSYENGIFMMGARSLSSNYRDALSGNKYQLSPCFAHAIDPRYARDGKLLPGAILPVLQYHANLNGRLYPGRVLTIDQDYVGDIEFHDDKNEVVLIIGTTEDVIHVHGNIYTKSLVVLGCTLIVDGDIYASDHIYAYALGIRANSITGNEDAICVSLFHTDKPYNVGPHSTLATDPETNPKLKLKLDCSYTPFDCLLAAGWISYELKSRCMQKDNLKLILEAATNKSKLVKSWFELENAHRATPEPEQDVWSEQAMEVLQWLQHPATSFADLRQFAIVGRCGIALPPNDPALQEEFRFQLIAALTEPASRRKLEQAWQLCSKLVDHRPLEDRKVLPPTRQIAAVKQQEDAAAEEAAEVEVLAAEEVQHTIVTADDFYEVVDDEQQ